MNFLIGQNTQLDILYGEPYDQDSVDSLFHELHEKNEYVVCFRIRSSWTRNTDFFVLTKQNNTITAFKYVVQSFDHFRKLVIPVDSLIALWHPYIDRDLFQLKDSKDILDSCSKDTSREGRIRYQKMRIEDSYHYEFTILSKTQMKKIDYYDPEYFEQYCGSVAERQKLIRCVSLIKRLLH